MAQAIQSLTGTDGDACLDGNADMEFEYRVAALEKLKCAIIADISRAKPIRLHAASLGEPDWPALQLIVALARLASALNLPFELVDAPEILVSRMDDAGIEWQNLSISLIEEKKGSFPPRNALTIF